MTRQHRKKVTRQQKDWKLERNGAQCTKNSQCGDMRRVSLKQQAEKTIVTTADKMHLNRDEEGT